MAGKKSNPSFHVFVGVSSRVMTQSCFSEDPDEAEHSVTQLGILIVVSTWANEYSHITIFGTWYVGQKDAGNLVFMMALLASKWGPQ